MLCPPELAGKHCYSSSLTLQVPDQHSGKELSEELRAAVPRQVRVGNQPLLSFQKLLLWSWARDTHLDEWCDGGQSFQGDL